MEKYILAIDSGTTSNRAILFDRAGGIAGQSQKEFTQIFPEPGWVEHDPEEIWDTQLRVIREVLERSGVDPRQIAGIGITNQRETAVVWDTQSGKPVGNAIVWQDRRTAGYCKSLVEEGKEEMIRDKTGLLADAYFSASKIRWILDHTEGMRKKAERGEIAFGTVDAWLLWKLTGGRIHATDVSNASRTMLFNIRTCEWDPELLDLFGIPSGILPQVVPSSGICGHTDPGLFGRAIPVSGMAGDQQAALFGQLCTSGGMVKNTYGTGCFVLMNTGTDPVFSGHRLLTTVAWKIGERVDYALEGSIFIAGAVVQWLRDKLRVIQDASGIEKLASGVKDNGGVFFVPAFTGLGAPHWDPYATGTIIGINRNTSLAHLARAALESIALQTCDVIRAMEEDAGTRMKELRADGGASVNDLLMQIQADVIRKQVVRPAVTETTALGAAYLAGLAVGFWDSIEEIQGHWKVDRTFLPGKEIQDNEDLMKKWTRAVERSRNWNING